MARLVIAEKEEAARRMAETFGCLERERDGVVYFESPELVIVPARGHLLELWLQLAPKSIDDVIEQVLEKEPYWRPTTPSRQSLARLRLMAELAKNCEEIIVATDWDREGEVIGYNIVRFIRLGSRKLTSLWDIPASRVRRAYFSMLTPDELWEAFANVREMDESLLAQGLARNYADTVFGLALTKALTVRFRKLYPELRQAVSLGRVQSPLLSHVVEVVRSEVEFRRGEPEESDEISVRVYIEVPLDGAVTHIQVFDPALESSDVEFVECVDVREEEDEERQAKPLPNTDDVMRELSDIIRPDTLMDILESLYLKGYATYPRTKSHYIPRNVLAELVDTLRAYMSLPESFRPENYPEVEKEVKMPITLTTLGIRAYFSGKIRGRERFVASYLLYRLIQSIAPPLRYVRRTAVFRTPDGYEFELLIGKRLLNPEDAVSYETCEWYPGVEAGRTYRIVRIYDRRRVQRVSAELVFRHHVPKDSDLVKWMMRVGIGTEATRHRFPSLLRERHYLDADNLPTILGETVARIISELNITPKMTARLEARLNSLKHLEDLKDVRAWVKEFTVEALERLKELPDEYFVLTCPEGHRVRLVNTKRGLMAVCDQCGKRWMIA